MLALKTQHPATQRELAAAVGIEGATLTHHLDAMQRAGLVTRERLAENRRVQRVELTDAGEAAFLRMREAARTSTHGSAAASPPRMSSGCASCSRRSEANVTDESARPTSSDVASTGHSCRARTSSSTAPAAASGAASPPPSPARARASTSQDAGSSRSKRSPPTWQAAGYSAEIAVVDALDEQAVAEHADDVAARAGSIDVSFNLIGRGDVHGTALVDLALGNFIQATTTGLAASFITATTAARHMVRQGSGVILGLTSGSSTRQGPMMGGTGAADAATESFLRSLAAEVGKDGVRVVGLWTAGVPGDVRPRGGRRTRRAWRPA